MEFEQKDKTQGEFTHNRIRKPFVEDARAAHEDGGVPNPASFRTRPDLTAEENAVLPVARDHYLAMFGDQPARLAPAVRDLEAAWEDPDSGLAVSGYLDLPLETDHGPELRQFELWGTARGICADPADSEVMLCLAVRSAAWVGNRPLRIVHADVVQGRMVEHVVHADEQPKLRAQLARRLTHLVHRASRPEPLPGSECGLCPYIPQCPAHWT